MFSDFLQSHDSFFFFLFDFLHLVCFSPSRCAFISLLEPGGTFTCSFSPSILSPSLLLLLPPSLQSFLPLGKDLPLPHASRLGGGGSDYRWRLSGEVAVEEEEEKEVRKGIRFHVSSGSPPSASLLPSLPPPSTFPPPWQPGDGVAEQGRKTCSPPLPLPTPYVHPPRCR